jgi:hypothetical protein
VAVVWKTRRQHIPAWKIDVMALLWHRLTGPGVAINVPGNTGPQDLQHRADELRARLVENTEMTFATEKSEH